jgi:glucose dehydrogenase
VASVQYIVAALDSVSCQHVWRFEGRQKDDTFPTCRIVSRVSVVYPV